MQHCDTRGYDFGVDGLERGFGFPDAEGAKEFRPVVDVDGFIGREFGGDLGFEQGELGEGFGGEEGVDIRGDGGDSAGGGTPGGSGELGEAGRGENFHCLLQSSS